VSANGVLGDPAGASPEEGSCLLDQAIDDLLAALEASGSPGSWGSASGPDGVEAFGVRP
jgi:creatinine amidohydrolase